MITRTWLSIQRSRSGMHVEPMDILDNGNLYVFGLYRHIAKINKWKLSKINGAHMQVKDKWIS